MMTQETNIEYNRYNSNKVILRVIERWNEEKWCENCNSRGGGGQGETEARAATQNDEGEFSK